MDDFECVRALDVSSQTCDIEGWITFASFGIITLAAEPHEIVRDRPVPPESFTCAVGTRAEVRGAGAEVDRIKRHRLGCFLWSGESTTGGLRPLSGGTLPSLDVGDIADTQRGHVICAGQEALPVSLLIQGSSSRPPTYRSHQEGRRRPGSARNRPSVMQQPGSGCEFPSSLPNRRRCLRRLHTRWRRSARRRGMPGRQYRNRGRF